MLGLVIIWNLNVMFSPATLTLVFNFFLKKKGLKFLRPESGFLLV